MITNNRKIEVTLTIVASLCIIKVLSVLRVNKEKEKQKQGRKPRHLINQHDGTKVDKPAIDASNPSTSLSTVHDWSKDLPSHMRREQMKELRRKKKLPLLSMKSQMYDNITMIDPQGNELSKISRKKGHWYVSKKLAVWVSNSNLNSQGSPTSSESICIQLKFEPKARPKFNNDYGKSTKKNICVACGGIENQMRFYIVPYTYRTLFPNKYKSKLSHDIALLCADCHLRCGQQTQFRMNELEDKFHIQKRYETDFHLYKVRSSALALTNWRHKIPAEKIASHESNVRSYFLESGTFVVEDGEEISKEQLQAAIDLDYRIENPDYVPGAKLLVDSIVGDERAMEEFIFGWRRFFLDTMHPKFLPQGWRVDYPVTSTD